MMKSERYAMLCYATLFVVDEQLHSSRSILPSVVKLTTICLIVMTIHAHRHKVKRIPNRPNNLPKIHVSIATSSNR